MQGAVHHSFVRAKARLFREGLCRNILLQFLLLNVSPSTRCLQRVNTVTISKVITQSRPLFYVDRAGHRLTEEANGIEAEDLEPTEVS